MPSKRDQRKRRHRRVRAKVEGALKVPRLCVFRSNHYLYVQLIDDTQGKIILAARGHKRVKDAYQLGKIVSERAKEKKIETIVFDRGGYAYHGRVKRIAEGAREGGLKF